ncbi:OB-fold domain-containing protein [Novosphingobium sp. Chol11]|uniref:Zn-ribbon domain-containing OB-fold protein n=1 Tax=Novosphingobium sp. Chol11 TaxID=1385763 RepID=UPI0025FF3372|nr:OB-fold domain-containing protein [Novosphingobium sp. Chol11]
MTSLTPIAHDLWTNEDPPRLIGGRRHADGEIVFPYPGGDAAANYEAIGLSRTGTLWSWTIQTFRPKSPPYDGPEVFEPFALGYVELPGEVIVETRLTQATGLKIGMPVELVIVPFDATRSTYAFKPVEN